ncbi:hypothetical protein RE9431_41220 [Prescottella equi]|nr:hypothetical protein RE9431_41220 [Prescottella equi]BCN75510.1 hypothetical protein RE0327_41090 [Prescottella equi]
MPSGDSWTIVERDAITDAVPSSPTSPARVTAASELAVPTAIPSPAVMSISDAFGAGHGTAGGMPIVGGAAPSVTGNVCGHRRLGALPLSSGDPLYGVDGVPLAALGGICPVTRRPPNS